MFNTVVLITQWLNSQTLVTLDSLEKIHILDVRSWEELEVIDMSDMKLVYSTSYFKGLLTGGNVSPALVSVIRIGSKKVPDLGILHSSVLQ